MHFENSAEEKQVHTNRETNEQLHGTLVLFSSHFVLDGKEADWEKANGFDELPLCQAQC